MPWPTTAMVAEGKPLALVISRISESLGRVRQFVLLVLDLPAQVGDALVECTLVDVLEAHQHAGDRFAAVGRHELDVLHLAQCVFDRVSDLFSTSLAEAPGRTVVMMIQLKLIVGPAVAVTPGTTEHQRPSPARKSGLAST